MHRRWSIKGTVVSRPQKGPLGLCSRVRLESLTELGSVVLPDALRSHGRGRGLGHVELCKAGFRAVFRSLC